MKKTSMLVLLTVLIVSLMGCNNHYENKLKVLVPSGTPSLIVANLMHKHIHDHQIVHGADPLVAAFTSKSHDVIFAPTNLGAMMYKNNQNYVLGAVIVWGNNFIISRNDVNIQNMNDLIGKKIYAFGKNQTPDIVLRTVLSYYNIENQVEIVYENDITTLTSKFLLGQFDIALMAEPSLSQLMLSLNLNIINLQNEWNQIGGSNGYPQVGVFIKSELLEQNKQVVDEYLSLIKLEMEWMKENKVLFSQNAILAHESFSLLGALAIQNAITTTTYEYKMAQDAKAECIIYFNIILSMSPNLIGGELPNEGYYM